MAARQRGEDGALPTPGGGDASDCAGMHPDLELALELTDIAAEIALPRFRDRDFAVTIKPDGSPVTDVDQAVERALRERLAQRRPDHAVLGEEYGASGESEWCWYLDPIDGTSGFVDGDPNWMTFVALGRGTEVAVGVISMPARAHRWWASRGDGAFEDGRRICGLSRRRGSPMRWSTTTGAGRCPAKRPVTP